jgi:hypothetical protein
MTNYKYTKFKDGKSFSCKVQRRLLWSLVFDKNSLGEESFALGMEILQDKRKGY